ncbi:MAG TPA: RNA polymerase sigma factor [Chloroflexia bacterium]|nr:RNA polymerase sigma factor [Chloroflexia bacterium]
MSIKEILVTEDESLVIRAASGEFAAFEELTRLYTQPLWKFVYRLLSDYEDANDVIQQILIQVYCSLPSLENPTRFRSWLFMIARNKCIDQLRRKSNLKHAEINGCGGLDGGDGDEDEIKNPIQLYPDPTPLPEELIEQSETRQLLLEAIAALPERSRQVVSLRYSTDLSFSEIGDVLGINENTAKTLFQRAKNQLRYYIRQRL